MSFILDALKKSESDRQRQSGPALFEVKVAPPRTGLPGWAVGVLALLVVNLGILGWMLLRRSPAAAPPAASMATAPRAAAPANPASPSAAAAAPAVASASGTVPGAVTSGALAPGAGPMSPPAAPQAAAPAAPLSAAPANTVAPELAAAAPPATAAPAGEDDVPATEPTPGEPFRSRVRHTTSTGLPLYPDAAGAQAAGLPMLRLDLHVFAARPQERFVLINMHRLREGDALPEGGGVRVDSITPDGAVLERNGTRYLLPRE